MSEAVGVPTAPVQDHSRQEIMRRFAAAFRVRPGIYWVDMLGSATLGWLLFVGAVSQPMGSPAHIALTVGTIFAMLRAALFIHELTHLKSGDLPGFQPVWSAFVGIPVLVPSLMYVGSHMDHHRRNGFGTEEDPEYAPIAHWSRLRIAFFVVTVAFVPLLLVLRFGLLGPLSRLLPFPRFRRFVVERMSTLVINTGYRRPFPKGRDERRWAWEEAGAALLVWGVAGGVALGWIPLAFVLQWFLMAAGVLVVNQVRTMAAHGYENAGEAVDSEGQLLDSINLTGMAPLTALVAPVGLRYHALHHYLPSLPYHSLGMVHRRLLRELPEDSPYRQTSREGILGPLQKLWYKVPA